MSKHEEGVRILSALEHYAAMSESEWRRNTQERLELVRQLQSLLASLPDKSGLLERIRSVLVKHGRNHRLSTLLVTEIFERAIEYWHMGGNEACEEIVAFLWETGLDRQWMRADAYALNPRLLAVDSTRFKTT